MTKLSLQYDPFMIPPFSARQGPPSPVYGETLETGAPPVPENELIMIRH